MCTIVGNGDVSRTELKSKKVFARPIFIGIVRLRKKTRSGYKPP